MSVALPSTDPSLIVPDLEASDLVIAAPGDGPGHWAGGPCAVLDDDGTIVLAYRMRRPVGQGRGYANVIARSADGVRFETICTLERDDFGAESLERPWIVKKPDGSWRSYISAATPGTKHWRVDAIDADDPSGFRAEEARTILPGDDEWGVKDPVIKCRDGTWQMWLCFHPLNPPQDADRMYTRYAASADGLDWKIDDGVALQGREGEWDSRGARVGDVVFDTGFVVAYYDGCSTSEQDTEELLGVAIGDSPEVLEAVGTEPLVTAPYATGSIRYMSVVDLPNGAQRIYYETERADGAHDLRTELIPPNG